MPRQGKIAGLLNPDAAASDRKLRHERAKQRYDDEVASLRAKLAELTEQLEALTTARAGPRKSQSVWEGFARRQVIEHQEALRENTKLKHQIELHMELLQRLQGVLAQDRHDLLQLPSLDPSAVVSLSLDPSARRATVHAVLDQQFAQLPATYQKHGLTSSLDTWKQIVVRQGRHEIALEISYNLLVHASPSAVGDALCEIFAPAQRRVVSNGSAQLLESFDATTHLLERVYAVPGQRAINTHLATKSYRSVDGGHAFVQQAIGHDALFPLPPDTVIVRDVIFTTVERCEGGDARWKSFRHVHIPLDANAGGDLVEKLLSCYGDSIEVLTKALHRVLRSPRDLVESQGDLITFNHNYQ
ncbi:hypothetical protein SDRG_15084 [Saprolegnia diclina VS20]|uniref:Uncharacterized protein n=1 Tax=Saprolegnia diclina (strain VS20) TaxID=1156394 RepID=T0PNT7_SAPDV|nr:hypothetical protein SDRG_15084 [Saprolegnia diclina VS20]EQC27074.1 hypothetical protein SDRG_15084 [Saprolegnia diclina VS20]|eukprot:XP_008619468.1 hypothetical protein SDRG_15084 [Saprolegnia diclina VS20]